MDEHYLKATNYLLQGLGSYERVAQILSANGKQTSTSTARRWLIEQEMPHDAVVVLADHLGIPELVWMMLPALRPYLNRDAKSATAATF